MSILPVPYISQIDEGRPVNDCGPACALMVARAYGLALDTTIDDLYRQHGYPDTGLSVGSIASLLSDLGVPCHRKTGSIASLSTWADWGVPAILLVDYAPVMQEGLHQYRINGGHFVVLTGFDDPDYFVHDPYMTGERGAFVRWPMGVMHDAWWPHGQYNYTAIVPDNFIPTGDDDVADESILNNIEQHLAAIGSLVDDLRGEDAPAPEPEPDYDVMYVSGVDPATLRVRDAAGFGGAVVGGLPEGTQVTVYERSGDWARIGVDRWVYALYLDFQPRR